MSRKSISPIAPAAPALGDEWIDTTYYHSPKVWDGTYWRPAPRTATLVVAASNSSAQSKAQADYVCDGTADNVEIQAAIDALPAGGGKVLLTEGTFNIAASIIVNKANMTLSGVGWANILKAVNALNSNIISVTARPTNIEFLKIDGNSANQASGNGIDIGIFSRRSKIHDVWLYYIKGSGIKTHTLAMDLNISAIQADHCGIAIELGGQGGFLLTDIYITDCTDGIVIAAIWVNLVGFRITTNTGRGIYITDTGAMAGGAIEIGSGDIDSCAKEAIEIYANAYDVDHVDIHDCLIDENSMGNNNVYDDIYVHRNETKVVRDVNIHDNWIYGPWTKYLIETGAGVSLSRIHDNMLTGGVTGALSITQPDTGQNVEYYTNHQEIFMDALAATPGTILTNYDLTLGVPAWPAFGQPDVPRNLTMVITDVNTSITNFKINVYGWTGIGEGQYVLTQFLFAGGLVQTKDIAYARITQVAIETMTGADAGDLLNIGIGSKLGLANKLIETNPVYKVKKNNANYPAASYTVNTTYNTVDVSTGGAIAGGDDFTIWYRAQRNKIQ